MLRSDEILYKASIENRSLTKSERQELTEVYKYEKEIENKNKERIAESLDQFDGHLTNELPRHRMHGKCADFIECPIDYKCRNYNPAFTKCLNCPLHETEDVCKKGHIHNERTFNMMIARERIDLDGEEA